MKVAIVTPSTQDPITLDEAKNFMKIDTEDDDGLILTQITAAKEYAEATQGRKFMTQTWKYYLDDWPDENYIELPFPPLQDVSTIKYTDYNGTQTTWSSSEWDHDIVSEPGRVILGYGYSWPTATLHPNNPIEIQFICGYGTPDDVPEVTKAGMKLIIDELYENREIVITGMTVNKLDLVKDLLYMNKVFKF